MRHAARQEAAGPSGVSASARSSIETAIFGNSPFSELRRRGSERFEKATLEAFAVQMACAAGAVRIEERAAIAEGRGTLV